MFAVFIIIAQRRKIYDHSSIETSITLLEAAKLRNDSNIINIAADLEDGEVPKLRYHKSYTARYTLKRNWEKLRKGVRKVLIVNSQKHQILFQHLHQGFSRKSAFSGRKQTN